MRALAAPVRRLDPGAVAVGGAAILLPGSAAAGCFHENSLFTDVLMPNSPPAISLRQFRLTSKPFVKRVLKLKLPPST